MSFKVVTSLSNTISTTLGVVDDTVDGVGSAARIFKTAMKAAEDESTLESFIEQKKLLKDSGLTEEEKEEYKALISA